MCCKYTCNQCKNVDAVDVDDDVNNMWKYCDHVISMCINKTHGLPSNVSIIDAITCSCRALRQRLMASGQTLGWQTTGRKTSQQDQVKKGALQRQQQQLAAQQAQIRLAAFQQATERQNAEVTRRRQRQAAAASGAKAAAKPGMFSRAPNVSLQPFGPSLVSFASMTLALLMLQQMFMLQVSMLFTLFTTDCYKL